MIENCLSPVAYSTFYKAQEQYLQISKKNFPARISYIVSNNEN